MPSVNPDILKWARQSAGMTPEFAVQKLGIRASKGIGQVDRLAALETGGEFPTRSMLKKMSKVYRRPLLTFYLPTQPKKGQRGEDFRTLPASATASDRALADAVMRDISARQSLVRMVLEEENEVEELRFIGSATISSEPSDVADHIQTTLKFDIAKYRKSKSTRAAVSYLRNLAEVAGIFVIFVDNLGNHHSKISVDIFRGFALSDDVAPFIAVNANDSVGAQAFTIVHELAHLWLGITGVSGSDNLHRTEKFCHDVASEFLLPRSQLAQLSVSENNGSSNAMQLIAEFADVHKVSRTMVSYRLYRSRVISFKFYEKIKQEFQELHHDGKNHDQNLTTTTGSGRPNYHTIRRHRAAATLVELVDRMLGIGALTTEKAGKVLGVSAKNVHGVLITGNPHPTRWD
ncbi:MAG: ImmA/IrrE family metallo-endopeptidase [Rhodobacteraceae bacterium]|nr:ImmA/IrrE family metallo-endopeptidase [Paracoccaceae bacterium]